ncbi:hypothetical protein A167_01362 [Alcanivorax sp. S71-1-4]|uniref:DUF86 domain-containing protein n=1 Tax=Isoalcanivorax pacificus W11-5 TaxID=391936 RepID=A0A0B4XJU5_9GAMM|nr:MULTISPECIES: DUF86 domain-containing protein [Alcanivoracaceae]AJD48534.1 hypothetical protein S7S_10610 [Isoalcanivorax pacificus W11-5]KAF0809822.1 hypothetical protein A167_01362 [Alcanivorax sp. S71-1-4]
MDRVVISEKLESLRRCLARLKAKCPDTPEALQGDLDAQDIVSLNLTRAIQLCVDIATHWLADHDELIVPRTMGEAFTRLAEGGLIGQDLAMNMRRAVGFRNIVVHNYGDIDWQIVHALCTQRMDDFRRYAQAIQAEL